MTGHCAGRCWPIAIKALRFLLLLVGELAAGSSRWVAKPRASLLPFALRAPEFAPAHAVHLAALFEAPPAAGRPPSGANRLLERWRHPECQ